MHNYILILGLIAAIFFFLIDKNLLPATVITRKYMLSRLQKNKNKEKELQLELEQLIDRNDAWSSLAFPDSEVTYKEYMELLKEKFSIEYADTEFEVLRSKRMSRKQVAEYLEKIKNQEEAAVALQVDVDYQKMNLQALNVAQAS